MDNGMIVSILSSSVIAALIAGYFSYRTQKKLNNTSFKIEYLNKKLSLLENAKNELTSLNNNKVSTQNREQLSVGLQVYNDEMLSILVKTIYNLKGYINSDLFKSIESDVSKTNVFITNEKIKHIPGVPKSDEDFSNVTPVLSLKKQLEQLIMDEIFNCTMRIEKIIEM